MLATLFGFGGIDPQRAMQNLEAYIRAYEPKLLQLPQQDPHAVFDLLAQLGVTIPMSKQTLSMGLRFTVMQKQVAGLVRYFNEITNLNIPVNQFEDIGYLTNHLYTQLIATDNLAYEECLHLLALAGHADAATKLGEHYEQEQYRDLEKAGYYYLVGAFLAQNREGNNAIEPVNAIRGARLVITTQANTRQPSPYLPLALAMLEHVVASDQSPSGLSQNTQAALDLLVDAHLMQVRFSPNTQINALRFNPQLAVVASGNTPNALGLALHFMRRYYPESDFQAIMLQLHYRLNTGYNAIGINQEDFRNSDIERLVCRLLIAVAPGVELLKGVTGERDPQCRVKQLQETAKQEPAALPSYTNH